MELPRLLGELPHEVLREHLREAGDVEDVLLGIQRRELSAELRQRVDDLRRRAAHAGVEEANSPAGPPPMIVMSLMSCVSSLMRQS